MMVHIVNKLPKNLFDYRMKDLKWQEIYVQKEKEKLIIKEQDGTVQTIDGLTMLTACIDNEKKDTWDL